MDTREVGFALGGFWEVSVDVSTHFFCHKSVAGIHGNRCEFEQTTADVIHQGANYKRFRSTVFGIQNIIFQCSIPLRLGVVSAVSDRMQRLQLTHVFAIGMHITVLASAFTAILKVNTVLHMRESQPAALVLVSAPLIVDRLQRRRNMIMNEFMQGNQFSSVPALQNQSPPSQPSDTHTDTKNPSTNYTLSSHSAESVGMDQKISE